MKLASLIAVAAAIAALATTAPARADEAADRRAAKALLDEGVALYDQGDYNAALDLFARGYQIYPSATLLMNMGPTFVQLGRGAEAANAYQAFLDDASTTGPRASEIRSSLAILDTTLGKVVVVAPPAMEIQFGDGPWQPAPRAHLVRVPPGTYVVRARQDGRTRDLTGRIGAGETQTVEPHLPEPEAVAAAPAPPAPAPPAPVALLDEPVVPAPRSHRRTFALISAGAGVVAAGAAVALAMRATDGYELARALCERPGGCGTDRARAAALGDGADRDRLLAIGASVVSAAALGAGAYLWIRAPHRRGDASAAFTLTAAPHQLGLAAAGTF